MKVSWSKRAETDFFEIFNVLDSVDPPIAINFNEKIHNLINLVSIHPKMGRIVPELNLSTIREVFWKRYRIIYRIANDCIEIVTIYHGSRILDLK